MPSQIDIGNNNLGPFHNSGEKLKLKICFIADGYSIHLKRWVNYFSGKGYEVHVISSRFSDGFYENIKLHKLIKLLPEKNIVLSYSNGLLWPIQVMFLIKQIKPDLVDAHYIEINGYLAALAGFHPLIMTTWGSDILITPYGNIFHRYLINYSLKKGDLILFNSKAAEESLINLGVSPSKLRKYLHGINLSDFEPSKKDLEIREHLGIRGESPLIISTRHLEQTYNLEMLIKAIPLVLKKEPDAKFVFVGDGPQRNYLINLSEYLGIKNATRFVGSVPHHLIPKYLSTSEVYVSTSITDSSPVSLQEAMASGLAVVVTDIPANREWITDGKNGFIVPLNDIYALSVRILFLLQNDSLRLRFGELNRRIVEETDDYNKEMEKIENIYLSLLDAKKYR